MCVRYTAPILTEILASWVIFNCLLFKTLYLEIISNLQKRIRLGQRLCAFPILFHLLYQSHPFSLYVWFLVLNHLRISRMHYGPFTLKSVTVFAKNKDDPLR